MFEFYKYIFPRRLKVRSSFTSLGMHFASPYQLPVEELQDNTDFYGKRSVSGITYRKVLYCKEVQKELFRLADKSVSGKELDDELRLSMYYLSYNSTRVLTYHAHYITSHLDKSEFRSEKLRSCLLN